MTPPTTCPTERDSRAGRLRLALFGVVALLLSGCAEATRIDAAGDIHAFLVAVRDNDQAGFDAHVDRPLLKAQIRSRLMELAARRGGTAGDLAALGLTFARPLADSLSDALIQPDVFHAVAEYFGYSDQTPIPGSLTIAASLRSLDDAHVCVARRKDAPCVLVFADEGGVWRLVGFEGDAAMLRLPKRF